MYSAKLLFLDKKWNSHPFFEKVIYMNILRLREKGFGAKKLIKY